SPAGRQPVDRHPHRRGAPAGRPQRARGSGGGGGEDRMSTEESRPRHPPPQPELQPPAPAPSPTRAIALAFTVSLVASVALCAVYIAGGQPQLEGLLLFFALGGIAAGFIHWGGTLLPQGPYVQSRHELTSGAQSQERTTETLEEGIATLDRRRLLLRLLSGAFVALGAALVF